MSREIKFRAWQPEQKQFYYHELKYDNTQFSKLLAYYPEAEPQQYTGLKDKNGVEIYEGDIIDMGPFRYTVEWIEAGAFKLKSANPLSTRGTAVTHAVKYGSVLGNIYENPELVK